MHAHFVSLDPGWGWAGNSKETKDPSEVEAYKFSNQYVQETNFSISLDGEALTGTWIEPFSWEPRAFVLHNILSDEECTHMISLAQPDVEASTVITNSAKHESGVSQVRTSFGTFLRRYHDEAVGKIEEMVSSIPTFSLYTYSLHPLSTLSASAILSDLPNCFGSKIAVLTGIPVPNGESLQVLSYEKLQRYREHEDYFDRAYLLEADGMQRIATVLLYLSDVDEGGETNFPQGQVSREYRDRYSDASVNKVNSECGGGLQAAVQPKKGDALLFFDMDPAFIYEDELSLHEGCPVISGTKWSATIWMHQGHFHGEMTKFKDVKPTVCENKHPSCESWAKSGKCEKREAYMRKNCMLSCEFCRKCAPGDVLCERKNVFV